MYSEELSTLLMNSYDEVMQKGVLSHDPALLARRKYLSSHEVLQLA